MIMDIIKELLFQSIGRIVPWLRRKIYPLTEFEKDIEIDLRRDNPITFSVNNESPYLTLYLTVKNKSQYLEFTFDRAIINFNTDNTYHEILKDASIISCVEVGKKSEKPINYKFSLNEYQVKLLKNLKDTTKLRASIRIKYYVVSDLYKVSKEIGLNSIYYSLEWSKNSNLKKLK